jgi:endonuclease YncB( thermonuclease family)
LTVTNVVDGDTVDLSDGRRVRLLGIDTPERGDCGFDEASQFARTTLLNQEVEVAADPTQDELDQYGRSLLYIGAPDDYSTGVARAGWARHYVFDNNPVQKAPQIEAAQRAAQAERLGIWGGVCAPPPPPPPTPPAPAIRQEPPPAPNNDNDTVRRPAAAPAPPPPPPPPPPAPASNCHPSYQPCVPDGPDLDCPEIGFKVKVVGPDEYRLDADKDGWGCESYG